jgi:hypothetical protein
MRTLSRVVAPTAVALSVALPSSGGGQVGHSIASQGVSVFYDVTGSGAPVVFLHGLGLDRQMTRSHGNSG